MYSYFKFLIIFVSVINSAKLVTSDVNSSDENDSVNNSCKINSSVTGKYILGDYRETKHPNGIPYCVFLGIPYAKPPIGNLRFKPPEYTNFLYDEVSIYTTPSYPCISKSRKTGVQREDCLYLNIFIPLTILQSNEKSAVVVWVHGGSYNVGSGLSDMHPNRGPELYIENDIIFVSFNYRLGALGFLRLPELNITGNYGLMDQRFALKWVHDNIHLWNGDKNNVTLMGWSAGSASVSYHLLANESNQYFKRVVLMSGSLLNPWAQFDYPEECVKQLLDNLNIEPQNVSRLLTINGTDFQRDRTELYSLVSTNVCFVPTVDRIIIGDTINYKLYKNVDIVIGWTSLEFQHFYLEMARYMWNNTDYNPFEYLTFFNQTEAKARRLWCYLKHEFKNNSVKYFDGSVNGMDINYRLLSKALSDYYFTYGIRNYVKKLLEANESENLNIFMYQFSPNGQYHMHGKFYNGLNGASHGDDLAHMYRTYQNLRRTKINYDEKFKNELFIQRAMVKMWTNFIKHGNPTPVPVASSPNDVEDSLIWENYKLQHHLLDINVQSKMIPDTDDELHLLLERYENCIQYNECSFLDECAHCA